MVIGCVMDVRVVCCAGPEGDAVAWWWWCWCVMKAWFFLCRLQWRCSSLMRMCNKCLGGGGLCWLWWRCTSLMMCNKCFGGGLCRLWWRCTSLMMCNKCFGGGLCRLRWRWSRLMMMMMMMMCNECPGGRLCRLQWSSMMMMGNKCPGGRLCWQVSGMDVVQAPMELMMMMITCNKYLGGVLCRPWWGCSSLMMMKCNKCLGGVLCRPRWRWSRRTPRTACFSSCWPTVDHGPSPSRIFSV